jgi:His-Xaa-Ser system protein HxsD
MTDIIPVKNLSTSITIKVQKSLYAIATVEAAVVPLMDFTTASFEETNQHIEVTLVLDEHSVGSIQDIEKAFLNNLVHESLREKIAARTEMERNLVLAYAFSNSKLMVNQ